MTVGTTRELIARHSQFHYEDGREGTLDVVAAIVSYLADGEPVLAYADRDTSRDLHTGLHFEALFATESRLIRLRTDGDRHVWLEAPRAATSVSLEVRLDSAGRASGKAPWSAGEQKPEIIFGLPRPLRFDDTDRLWIWAPLEHAAGTADPMERVRMWRQALQ